MSRTYRRKNEPFWLSEKEFDEDKIEFAGSSWLAMYRRDTYVGELAHFHSDGDITMQQVPKWYKVQFCRRPFRRAETRALIQELKSNYEGEIPFPVIKKDALYYW